MIEDVYRYEFQPSVPMEEVEASLLLATWAAEALDGEAQVRLDDGHVQDRDSKRCVLDGGTEGGRDINHLFTGYLRRELPSDQFSVRRVEGQELEPVGVAA